jgi:hypothetical protein
MVTRANKGEIMKAKGILFFAMALTVGTVLTASANLIASTVSSAMRSSAAPDGWKVLVDRTKTCQISVPSDWVVDKLSPTFANAPDAKANVIMHATPNQTMATVKSTMEGVFPPTKIIEDSPNRLWYAYKAASTAVDSPGASWYVGIPVKTSVCGAQLDFKNSSSEGMMKQIVESMTAVK